MPQVMQTSCENGHWLLLQRWKAVLSAGGVIEDPFQVRVVLASRRRPVRVWLNSVTMADSSVGMLAASVFKASRPEPMRPVENAPAWSTAAAPGGCRAGVAVVLMTVRTRTRRPPAEGGQDHLRGRPPAQGTSTRLSDASHPRPASTAARAAGPAERAQAKTTMWRHAPGSAASRGDEGVQVSALQAGMRIASAALGCADAAAFAGAGTTAGVHPNHRAVRADRSSEAADAAAGFDLGGRPAGAPVERDSKTSRRRWRPPRPGSARRPCGRPRRRPAVVDVGSGGHFPPERNRPGPTQPRMRPSGRPHRRRTVSSTRPVRRQGESSPVGRPRSDRTRPPHPCGRRDGVAT